jgi:hypothetical protein
MQNRMIIYLDKKDLSELKYLWPYIIIGIFFNYCFISYFITIPNWVSFIVIFLLGSFFLYAWWLVNDPEPIAILDFKGIWLPRHGLIHWTEITELSKLKTPGVTHRVIGIRVKDLHKIGKQSTYTGKWCIFWSFLSPYPPIIIANPDININDIISFANKWMV